jgi:formylmethanofuran dehydrogenase subunit C
LTDPVEIALITAGGVVLSGSLSTIVLMMMKRLEVKVDGRLTDLINANKRADQAEGHAEGVKAEQDRTTKGT